MKKWIALILAFVMVLGMVGCGGSAKEPEPTATPAPRPTATPKTGPSDAELKKALEYIKQAEDYIIRTASIQCQRNDFSSWILDQYFVDSAFEKAKSEGKINSTDDRQEAYNCRKNARENLEKAKNILGTNGTGDFYNAVKEYYKQVNAFYKLVSTFPEGYSSFTYRNKVSDYKENCANAYEDASFYT